jgi:hypothetical protein
MQSMLNLGNLIIGVHVASAKVSLSVMAPIRIRIFHPLNLRRLSQRRFTFVAARLPPRNHCAMVAISHNKAQLFFIPILKDQLSSVVTAGMMCFLTVAESYSHGGQG